MSTTNITSINPTEGFVSYTLDTKPYHTKILEVNVDYVYRDMVNVTIQDNIKWVMNFSTAYMELLRSCGWGIEWDPIRTTNDYPKIRILRAYGDVFINVTIENDEVTIVYNNDEYQFTVGDPITFTTTEQFPKITQFTSISPGLVYYIVDIQDNVFKISYTLNGDPIVFLDGGSGTLSIKPANIPYNAFDVEHELAPEFEFVVSDTKQHRMSFVNNYDIIGIDALNRTWIISGDHVTTSEILPDNKIYIRDNTGRGANTDFTVDHVVLVDNDTHVIVKEHISVQASGDGRMGVTFNETTEPPFPVPLKPNSDKYWPTPSWAIGTKVRVWSNDRLPKPLTDGGEYYYVPMPTLGIFALSTKRFPKSISDLVEVSSFGIGILNIQRAETFYPGATIKVDSTYQSRNNGVYYVRDNLEYDDFVRLVVVQKVDRISPSYVQYDGIATIVSDGWDYPFYCPLIQSDDLYTEAFIQERLHLEFEHNYRDTVGVHVTEDDNTVVLASSPGYTILLTGYDTQFLDIGNVDENIENLPNTV